MSRKKKVLVIIQVYVSNWKLGTRKEVEIQPLGCKFHSQLEVENEDRTIIYNFLTKLSIASLHLSRWSFATCIVSP